VNAPARFAKALQEWGQCFERAVLGVDPGRAGLVAPVRDGRGVVQSDWYCALPSQRTTLLSATSSGATWARTMTTANGCRLPRPRVASGSPAKQSRTESSADGSNTGRTTGATPEARQVVASGSDMVPVSAMREAIGALQVAHAAALMSLERQLEQVRADHARETATRDTLHQVTISELRRIIDCLTPRNDAPATLPRPWWAPSWFGPAKRSRLRSP